MKTPMPILACGLILLAACGPPPLPVTTSDARFSAQDLNLGPDDVLLIGAGDIAKCRGSEPAAQRTGNIIRSFPNAKVFTLGDNAYRNGTARQFGRCYNRVWGSFRERTYPSPGNHDYGIYPLVLRNNADHYFRYFGPKGEEKDESKGFYSFDLGSWHIVSLNSMAGQAEAPGAPTMGEQIEWLRKNLTETKKPCILAFWHHPLFSSGEHGHDPDDPGRQMRPLWEVLHEHHADIVLNGHDHHYERFALQNPKGEADSRGIREILVGNGGGRMRRIQSLQRNSEVQVDGRGEFGVLLLTLHPKSYEWRFLKTDGTVGDASSGPQECH